MDTRLRILTIRLEEHIRRCPQAATRLGLEAKPPRLQCTKEREEMHNG